MTFGIWPWVISWPSLLSNIVVYTFSILCNLAIYILVNITSIHIYPLLQNNISFLIISDFKYLQLMNFTLKLPLFRILLQIKASIFEGRLFDNTILFIMRGIDFNFLFHNKLNSDKNIYLTLQYNTRYEEFYPLCLLW